MGILISWATIAAGLYLADKLLSGFHIKGGIGSFFLVAAIFAVLNFFLGWFIFGVLGVVSLGLGFLFAFLTRLVVTALILKLADVVSDRLQIRSFGVAFGAACIMAVASFVVDLIVR